MEQQQQARCRTPANVDPAIPDSDPAQTDAPWLIVRDASEPSTEDTSTMSSDSEARPKKAAKRQTRSKASTKESAYCEDTDYEATVLSPRGIKLFPNPVDAKTPNEKAFVHFGTTIAPESGKSAHYQQQLGSEFGLFVDGGHDLITRIKKEYHTAESWGYIERRYGNLAVTFLLLQDVMDCDREKTGIFMAERRDEESIAPLPHKGWLPPPVLAEDEDTKPCDFNLFPDGVYWLSLQAFPGKWTSNARHQAYIYRNRALLPYLSIEYKQNAWDERAILKGLNQMASSSSICQYNRYRLRYKKKNMEVNDNNVQWTTADSKAIRHYGMTLNGHMWEVYLAEGRISPKGEWMGSDIKLISDGSLQELDDVETFVDWINEIHFWGLGKYARDVREDIEALVGGMKAEKAAT